MAGLRIAFCRIMEKLDGIEAKLDELPEMAVR
jgi:hypothetical protein